LFQTNADASGMNIPYVRLFVCDDAGGEEADEFIETIRGGGGCG
jgi:hypothetical protein